MNRRQKLNIGQERGTTEKNELLIMTRYYCSYKGNLFHVWEHGQLKQGSSFLIIE